MSYIVLARKWRPRLFSELIGQETVSTILSNAIKQGRIAHAYLFSGPRGVGKTSTARILAKALNCSEGPTENPCGRCQPCMDITGGHSVDVMEIDGASNNSVEDIRDLREKVKYAPSSGRYKVYIIDEAHMLSQSAFNALLKTLEEPPPHVIFVLATTAPHKVPVTVLSRCQHLSFRRVSSAKMKEHLGHIASVEGIDITPGALDMIVKAADGGMRDALTLLDQLNSFTDRITEEEIRDILGLTETELIAGLALKVVEADRGAIIDMIAELHERGTDFKGFIKDLIEFVRQAMLVKISGSGLNEVSESERDYLKKLINRCTDTELSLLLSELMKIETEMRTAFSSRIALEVGLIRASMLSTLRPVNEILKGLESLEGIYVKGIDSSGYGEGSEAAPDGTDTTEEERYEADEPIVGEEGFSWEEALKGIEAEDSRLASKLMHAHAEFKGGTLTLTFNGGHSFLADLLRDELPRLRELMSDRGVEKVVLKKSREQKKTLNNGREEISPQEKLIIDELGGRIIERRKRDV